MEIRVTDAHLSRQNTRYLSVATATVEKMIPLNGLSLKNTKVKYGVDVVLMKKEQIKNTR